MPPDPTDLGPANHGSAHNRPADFGPTTQREAMVRRFVRDRYGLRGTLRLHRAALGWDLLRAPVNVTLSPVFLLGKLTAAILRRCGARRAADWLGARQIFLTSDVARRLEADLTEFFAQMDARGLAPDAPPDITRSAINGYAETRNAVSEITTSLLVLLSGLLLFHRATPGVMSLAQPIAHLRAQTQAVEDFALGSWAGRMWYGAFPAQLSGWEIVLTGLVLAVLASVLTTFAGLIADPVQLWCGTHRRRLMRLIERLDRHQGAAGLEREHVLARLGDLGDVASSLWRWLR